MSHITHKTLNVYWLNRNFSVNFPGRYLARITFNVLRLTFHEFLDFLEFDPLAHGGDHPTDGRVVRQSVGVVDAMQAKRFDRIFVIASRADRALEEGHFKLFA